MTGSINIDGKDFKFNEGETILSVARRNHIPIPVLCYLQDIAEIGACRICLVEVEGINTPVVSCATFATEGMVVRTNTEEIKKQRRNALEFILMRHPLECETCQNGNDCQLRRVAKLLGVSEIKGAAIKKRKPLIDWNMFWYDEDLCVICQRCVKVCNEVTGCNALEVTSRDGQMLMSTVDETLVCDYCGICADVCPVGAIMDKSFRYDVRACKLDNINTSCPSCPVGCKLNYGIKNNKIYRVHKSSDGYTCSKGRYGFKFLDNPKRLIEPMIKSDGKFVKSTIKESLETIKDAIVKYGERNSLIVVGSRLSNEEIFSYKTLADKAGMMFLTEAEITIGGIMRRYHEKFGRFESVGTLKDIETTDLIFVIGADFARECVGIKWHVMKAGMRNDAKIITIGLQRYEYDEYTHASIIADYGDFARVFDKFKSGDGRVSTTVREYISNARSISIIFGNEYLQAEDDLESILDFADFIGSEKLKVFMPSNDKANYVGALYMGGNTLSEVTERKPKVVFATAVNPTKGKVEPLLDIINGAEFYAAPEIFVTGVVESADVIIPVKSSLECGGTYTALDGGLCAAESIVEAPAGVISNSEIASQLGKLFNIDIEHDEKETFVKNAAEFGYMKDDLANPKNIYRRSGDIFFNKTEYTYVEKDTPRQKAVYVNPRHHEGVLTMIMEDGTASKAPFSAGIEVIIKPGSERFMKREDNIAKGIDLVPRGIIK